MVSKAEFEQILAKKEMGERHEAIGQSMANNKPNEQQKMQNKYEGMGWGNAIKSAAESPVVNGMLAAGEAAGELPFKAMDFLKRQMQPVYGIQQNENEQPSFGMNQPQPHQNRMMQMSQPGTSQNVGHAIGDLPAYMMANSPGGRIATAGFMGGMENPQNPVMGELIGLGLGGAGEAIGAAPKELGEVVTDLGEEITGNKFVQESLGELQDLYRTQEKEALSHLTPLMEKHGITNLAEDAKQAVNSSWNNVKELVTPDVESAYKAFKKNMNLENLHDLQSEFGKQIRAIKGVGHIDIQARQKLIEARNNILDSLKSTFEKVSPGAAKAYDQFRIKYATGPGAFLNNEKLNAMRLGEVENLTVKKMKDILGGAINPQESSVSAGHALRLKHAEVADKLNRMKLFDTATGSPLAKKLGFNLADDVLLNPMLHEWIGKGHDLAAKLYNPLKTASISALLSRNNQQEKK